MGHFIKDCPAKKMKKIEKHSSGSNPQVNVVIGGSEQASGSTGGLYVSFNPQVFIIYEPNEWILDTGANVHVCADKSLFVSYQAIHGRSVTMGNATASRVLGIGRMDLRLPSGVFSLYQGCTTFQQSGETF